MTKFHNKSRDELKEEEFQEYLKKLIKESGKFEELSGNANDFLKK